MDNMIAPPNSKVYKEETKKEEITHYNRVINETPIAPRKNKLKQSFLEFLLPDDTPDFSTYVENQTKKILKTIIFPKLRDLALDSISAMMGGGSVTSTVRTQTGAIPRVAYDSYSKSATRAIEEPKRSTAIYEEIGFVNPESTKSLLVLVEDAYYSQGYITVLQLYDWAGRRTTPEQNNYGWTTITGMRILAGVGENGESISILRMPSYPVPIKH